MDIETIPCCEELCVHGDAVARVRAGHARFGELERSLLQLMDKLHLLRREGKGP